ncbi:MAG: 3-deoxy-manno-octulosonate cytidylyltransferase [Planctomycetota bacterium]|jgi:3-deoxy-manno-octulosonate cytidylyltransferase (CMP-KDO synthetase)
MPGRTLVVVPARRASSRLPEKLLLAESGKPLLAYTLEACGAAKLPDGVVAAVDDPVLQQVALDAGVDAVLTDPELPSGTDRMWAAAKAYPDAEFLINVQGDEAEIEPEAIDAVCQALQGGCPAVTLSAPLPSEAIEDPAAVKVVSGLNGDALYFSREGIPYARRDGGYAPRLHLGVYGYRREVLERFATWEPTPLERTECLEQLRLLEHGVALRVLEWPHAFAGIDTRKDYDAFLQRRKSPDAPLP